jgi:hypothetical protein
MGIGSRLAITVAAVVLMVGVAQAADNVLVAAKATAAPKLDADAGDPAWQAAKPITVQLGGGANFKDGRTTVTLKAVYVGDMLYMLAQWDDADRSYQRAPYKKQSDGKWMKLKDPGDKGGDNNKYYEDKFAFVWNIGGSIKGFENAGCGVTCHAGEAPKPYGNKYTASAGELGDIWHAKLVRTLPVGQIDDQYLDHRRWSEKNAGAGRHSDPKTGGGYENVKAKGGMPEVMSKDARPANRGGTYWLEKTKAVPMDSSKFKPGDEVAGIMIAPLTGDRGDLSAAAKWVNGKWTLELARKRVTGSKYDVQFDNLGGTYAFGVAAFNNAQVRHAMHFNPLLLKFEK